MDNKYLFITRWKIKAPLEDVWKAILESEKWPQWWKSVKEVTELKAGNEDGIGSIRRYKMQSPMLYTLCFDLVLTEREEYRLLKGEVKGELCGTGFWEFIHDDGICEVICTWNVATTVLWMNKLDRILKPIFKYNHAQVMKQGAKYLSGYLKAPLLQY